MSDVGGGSDSTVPDGRDGTDTTPPVDGRGGEVDFVLRHVNDLNVVCVYEGGQVHDPVARRRRLEEETPTPAWGIPGATASRYH